MKNSTHLNELDQYGWIFLFRYLKKKKKTNTNPDAKLNPYFCNFSYKWSGVEKYDEP